MPLVCFTDIAVVYPAIIALNGGVGVSPADSAFGMSDVGVSIWFGIIAVKMAAEVCLIPRRQLV